MNTRISSQKVSGVSLIQESGNPQTPEHQFVSREQLSRMRAQLRAAEALRASARGLE